MSKIELTEEQAKEVYRAFTQSGGYQNTVRTTLDKAIELGLVRPASDDDENWTVGDSGQVIPMNLAARVAALEAKVDAIAKVEEVRRVCYEASPDTHAAAKERAKLWGARLIRCRDKWFIFVTDRAFTASGWSERKDSLGKPDAVLAEEFTGQWSTEYDAWSNFPTEPPPGWEAPKGLQ